MEFLSEIWKSVIKLCEQHCLGESKLKNIFQVIKFNKKLIEIIIFSDLIHE